MNASDIARHGSEYQSALIPRETFSSGPTSANAPFTPRAPADTSKSPGTAAAIPTDSSKIRRPFMEVLPFLLARAPVAARSPLDQGAAS